MNVLEIDPEELKKIHRELWFMWLKDVCVLLDKPSTYGIELMKDMSWFYCFDDGLSPAQAVAEARSKGVVK